MNLASAVGVASWLSNCVAMSSLVYNNCAISSDQYLLSLWLCSGELFYPRIQVYRLPTFCVCFCTYLISRISYMEFENNWLGVHKPQRMHPRDRNYCPLKLSLIFLLTNVFSTPCHALSAFIQPLNANNLNTTTNVTEPEIEFEPERSLEELYPTGKYLDPCKASKFIHIIKNKFH